MTTTTTTPPCPPPENNGDALRGERGQDDDNAGRRRDGSGGKQGRGCDERDEKRLVLGERVICVRGRRRRHGSCIVPQVDNIIGKIGKLYMLLTCGQ